MAGALRPVVLLMLFASVLFVLDGILERLVEREEPVATIVEAGFDRVTYHNMTAGIVALHRGIKP